MKFFLLKALLLHKGKDEGFTLPMVIAIGLVMLLLSLVNLVQSSEEQIIATSQQQSSEAFSAAEIGVGRYRDLLLNNRFLAVNNLARWEDADVNGQTCNIISNTGNGWADNSNTAWKNITVAGTDIGSYRIVDYEYDRNGVLGDMNAAGIPTNPDQDAFSQLADDGDINDDNDYNNDPDDVIFDLALNNHNDILNAAGNYNINNFAPAFPTNGTGTTNTLDGRSDARGILTIQGRDSTGALNPGDSITQIQVIMPLGINIQDMANLSPALWIGTDAPTAIGNNINVNGANIVYKDDTTSDDCADPTNIVVGGTPQNTISDARDLPSLLNITGLPTRDIDGDLILNVGTTPNFYDTVDREIVLGTTLDNDDDNDPNNTPGNPTQAQYAGDDNIYGNEDDRYIYTANLDLTLDAGESIFSDGDSRVVLYIPGDLTIITDSTAGQTNLVNTQHNSLNVEIARYLEIHVAGDVSISGNGNLKITGLLRVDGTVTINGSPNIEVLGAIWANNWDDVSTGTIDITPDDLTLFSIVPDRTPAPITFRPTNWETQEVTP